MSLIDNLEAMLAKGQDNALLRFSLGNAYLKEGKPARAVEHLQAAIRHDPGYSAAWKTLGKALIATGDHRQAVTIFAKGITIAEDKGDIQAAKEMRVFLKRLQRPQ